MGIAKEVAKAGADAGKSLYRAYKSSRDAKRLKKIKYSPAAVASRVKAAKDETLAAKEVDDAIKFGKSKKFIKGAGVGIAGAYVANKVTDAASKKKVTVIVSDRKKPAAPKKKVVKKKKSTVKQYKM